MRWQVVMFVWCLNNITPSISQKIIYLDNRTERNFNFVYDIHILPNNQSLFATDNGLLIFDGAIIKPLIPVEELPSKEVLDIYLDSKHRLWFNFFNGSIGFIDQDSIKFKRLHVVGKFKQSYSSILEFHDKILIGNYSNFSVFDERKLEFSTKYIENMIVFYAKKKSDSLTVIFPCSLKNIAKGSIATFNKGQPNLGCLNKSILAVKDYFRLVYFEDQNYLSVKGSNLYLITDSTPLKLNFQQHGLLHQNIISFSYNKNLDMAFCGGHNTGLYKINHPFSKNPKITKFLPNISVLSLKFDNFSNLLIGTSNIGIIIVPNRNLEITNLDYLNEKSLVNSNFTINKEKSNYLVSDEFCNFLLLDSTLNILGSGNYNDSKLTKFGTIRDFIITKNKIILGTDFGLKIYNLNFNNKKHIPAYAVKDLQLLKYNWALVATSNGLYVLNIKTLELKNIMPNRIIKIALIDDNKFFVSTNDSLLRFTLTYTKDNIQIGFDQKFQAKNMNDIRKLSNGMLLMIDAQGGINYYKSGHFKKVNINSQNSPKFSKIGEVYNNRLFMILANGLFSADLSESKDSLLLKNEKILNINKGIFNSNVSSLELLSNGDQFISYLGHLEIIPRKFKLAKRNMNKPELYSIKSKSKTENYNGLKIEEIQIKENDLPLILTYVSPTHYSTKFFYKINSLTDFSSFDNSGFQITNLPPGEYEIQVVSDSPTENSKNVSHLKLSIKPNFYNRPIFKILLSLLIFSILIGIAFYLYEIKESKLRVEFDKKLMLHENNKLKLDILRTQMNPHFNFNALQTVIRVLQKGELSTGTEYLFKISKLQRRILESTKREFIEINEEIEILNLYLDIEMARFSKKLTIDFHVDEDLDEDTQEIPPMIVQPLIENAIWHGLSDDRVTNKKLTISFKANRNQLIVSVSDNGLGMDLKNMNNRSENSNHNSIGIKNIIQRIENLNSTVKKYSFSLNFASSMDVGSSGTTVTYIQTFRT